MCGFFFIDPSPLASPLPPSTSPLGARLCDSRPFHNNIQFFILELLLYLGKLGAVFGVGAPSLTPSGERSAFLSRGSSGQVQLMWRVHWGMEPYIFTPLCFGHWDGTAAWVHQGCGQHGGLKPARLTLPLCWPAFVRVSLFHVSAPAYGCTYRVLLCVA